MDSPLTKEIAFARLDKRLIEKEKNSIFKSMGIIEFHFLNVANVVYLENVKNHKQPLISFLRILKAIPMRFLGRV